ncbi:MAG: HepT-like ribonuclease domain-containing protein [Methylococcales bacterium]
MQRDPRAYLWDVREAAAAILEFVAGKSYDDYAGDRLLRSAVERQFEIIGEALNQLGKIEPRWAERIPDLRLIVAFRNLLIHGYASVNDLTVWRTIETSLPVIYDTVSRLLEEADAP